MTLRSPFSADIWRHCVAERRNSTPPCIEATTLDRRNKNIKFHLPKPVAFTVIRAGFKLKVIFEMVLAGAGVRAGDGAAGRAGAARGGGGRGGARGGGAQGHGARRPARRARARPPRALARLGPVRGAAPRPLHLRAPAPLHCG